VRPDSASHDDPYSHPRAAEPRVASAYGGTAHRPAAPRKSAARARPTPTHHHHQMPGRPRATTAGLPASSSPPPILQPPCVRTRHAQGQGTETLGAAAHLHAPRVTSCARGRRWLPPPGSTTATRWWVSALGVVGRQDGRWRARRPGWAAPTAAVVRRPRTSCCSA
jgi:hypothetical protein